MSLPTPHIQALSTYNAPGRATPPLRNISSPYSLAIPPRSNRLSTIASEDGGSPKRPKSASIASSVTLQGLTVPEKALIVSEKPIHPFACDDESTPTMTSTLSSTIGSTIGSKISSKIGSEYKPVRRCAEKPKMSVSRWKQHDNVLALSVTLTLALLLAIGIPLGIILPQKLIRPLPINVLIPLYVYPEPGVWERLYDAIVVHHSVKFTIIINPDNGPGSTVRPSEDYISVVKALNVYPNVQTLGYISTEGGNRDNETVRYEIARYAGWSNVSDTLSLDGIYFDQTPFKDEENARVYLKNISATVRHSEGFRGAPMVVHNPGRVPDEGLMVYKPDLAIVFEGVYADMPRKENLHNMLEGSRSNRQDLGMLIHSVPSNISRGGLRKIIDDVRRDVEWLFVTDLTEDVYTWYGSIMEEWLNLVW
ncbi:Spherulation-specific family 4-domain-containing protein [Pyrenochaeta sp. MPI-SDFR-AT-0127]|nr:Spherulation-specific family 4-domain-containing protein [Pyrenochaeta sp. MPI-SDFR-AT-0127]